MKRDSNIIIYSIKEKQHRFYGLGDFDYIYDNKNLLLTIVGDYFHIEYQGAEAKRIMDAAIYDEYSLETMKIVELACESTHIPAFRIYDRRRGEEAVFSRWLVFHYTTTRLNYTQQKAAMLFGMEHASALHGIRELTGMGNKNLKPIQEKWKQNFIEKVNIYLNDKDIHHEKQEPYTIK